MGLADNIYIHSDRVGRCWPIQFNLPNIYIIQGSLAVTMGCIGMFAFLNWMIGLVMNIVIHGPIYIHIFIKLCGLHVLPF